MSPERCHLTGEKGLNPNHFGCGFVHKDSEKSKIQPMKNFLLLMLFAAFGAIKGSGQNSDVLPLDNAQWKELHITIGGPVVRYSVICGDTTINQQRWSKVKMVSTDTNLQVLWSIYMGALRNEGQKTWYIPAESTDSILLYDFALEDGDTFQLAQPGSSWMEKMVVDYTEELLIGDKLRKVIHFEPLPWAYEEEHWMEGIGSNRGLLNRGTGQGPDYGTYLSCFRHNDELINFSQLPCEFPNIPECPYTAVEEPAKPPVQLFVSPNPVSDQFFIDVSGYADREWYLEVFDLNGRQMVMRPSVTFPFTLTAEEWPAGAYVLLVTAKWKSSLQAARLVVVQH